MTNPPPGNHPHGTWGPPPNRPGDPWGGNREPVFPAYAQGPGRPAGPPGPGGPPGPPAPRKSGKGALPIIIGAVVVTVLLVGGLVAALVVAGQDTKEKGVQRYFDALGKTYSDELADHVVNVPDAAALADARKMARSQDYTVTSVNTSGNTAIVQYTVAGRSETVDLEMRKVDGKWKVVDGFSEITVKSGQKGVEFALGYSTDSTGDKAVVVYPGTYELRSSTKSAVPSYLWEASSADKYVTVKPGEKKTVNVDVALTKNGADRVKSAIGSAFSRCATGSDVAPQGCPFSVPAPGDRASSYGRWDVANGTSRYEVAQRARIADNQPFDAVCGEFDANVVYEYRNGAGYQRIPVNKTKYTACVDLTAGNTPTVTWK